MINCEHCLELRQTHEIRSPSELRKTINIVRDNLLDQTITESKYWPEGEEKIEMVPFSQVVDSAQTEDVLLYFFECPKCEQIFKLFCETYHGAGGEWSPVN